MEVALRRIRDWVERGNVDRVLILSGLGLERLPELPNGLKRLWCSGNPLPLFKIEDWRRFQRLRRSIILRRLQQKIRCRVIRRRARYKDRINYAIYGRPGLGVGWFEFCETAGLDPGDYDRLKYDLRCLNDT